MNNRNTEIASDYHSKTKHSSWSVRQGAHPLDWSNRPLPFKIYPDLEPMPLPREWEQSQIAALSAISSWADDGGGEQLPDLEALARLLYFSGGITKRRSYPGGEILFRAASCTGALYEVEQYVVCGDLQGLSAGVYHFNPGDFALRRLRQADYRGVLLGASGEEPSLIHAPFVIISTGTYWRNAWKYRARTYRHFGWDNGTLLANLLAMSTALGLPARLLLGFVDEDISRLLDLDTDREVVLSMVAIGQGQPRPHEPSPPVEPLRLQTVPLSREEVDYPEMRAMQASTLLPAPREAAAWRGPMSREVPSVNEDRIFPLEPYCEEEMSARSLEKVIRGRGSTRQFEDKSMTLQKLSTLVDRSTRGIPADFLEPAGATLSDWYLIVNAVEGLPNGAYVLHREAGSNLCQLELLKEGNFRRQAGYLGLEQALPADASVDIFFLADLNPILERFGNRGYRAVQLEAGILGGKVYLGAYAQRLGATGLTFYDDDVIEFFSPHAKGKSAIFLMAVGKGRKRKILG